MPRTGHRFAGIYSYYGGDNTSSYREYLQVELKQQLVPGEYYCGEFYASLAEMPHYASNGLGMYFHHEKLVPNLNPMPKYCNPLPYTPQILGTSVITDTANWVKVSGIFQATSAAKYLIVGNFFDDQNTLAIHKNVIPDSYWSWAYYFIDDVSVEKMPYDKFFYSGDAGICKGETAIITANGGNDNVTWTTLSDTLTVISNGPILNIKPVITTSYRVSAKGCNKRIIDTITVDVRPIPEFDLGNDTTLCEGTSLQLDAPAGHIAYKWQDSSTASYYNVHQAGKYSVSVKNYINCSASDEINVSYLSPPEIDLGNDRLVCNDFPTLKAGMSYALYEWSTGSTDSVYTPSAPGTYWVYAENRCGHDEDTIALYNKEEVLIPNVVTVNNDGYNDKLEILNANIPGKLKVFNRLGKEIYFSDDYQNEWPTNSQETISGTYYYMYTPVGCTPYRGWISVLK